MNPKRKILFVTPSFPPMTGGIAVYSWELCRGLHQLDQHIRVLTCADPLSQLLTDFRVINFKENPHWGKMRRWAIWKPLIQQIENFRPDVIFLASVHPYGFFIKRVAQRYSLPFVVASHGQDVWRLANLKGVNRIERWLGRTTFLNARRIFSVSRFIAGLVQIVAPSARSPIVIPNGVNMDLFKATHGDQDFWSHKCSIDLSGKRVLTSVGALQEHKGYQYVLKALTLLRERLPHLVYLIAGDGPLRKPLEAQVKESKLSGRVGFLGSVSRDELSGLLHTSDLFILINQPEPGEGFGLVFLEANACALPVIGGKAGGVPEVIKDGETGFLVNPQDPEQIASMIEKLATDEPLRHKLGNNGYLWAQEHDWRLIVPRYLENIHTIFA